MRRHFALAPGVRLVNEYGPTEATVFGAAPGEVAGAANRPEPELEDAIGLFANVVPIGLDLDAAARDP